MRPRAGGYRHPANRRRFEQRTRGERLADDVTGVFGSWRFIVVQTVVVALWIAVNLVGFARRWDPYPFILLNLVFSTQAAYAAPLILLSQNRQSDTDRIKAEHDYQVNQLALGYLVAWHRDAHGRECRCVQDAVDDEPMIELGPDAARPPAPGSAPVPPRPAAAAPAAAPAAPAAADAAAAPARPDRSDSPTGGRNRVARDRRRA